MQRHTWGAAAGMGDRSASASEISDSDVSDDDDDEDDDDASEDEDDDDGDAYGDEDEDPEVFSLKRAIAFTRAMALDTLEDAERLGERPKIGAARHRRHHYHDSSAQEPNTHAQPMPNPSAAVEA